jgi:signal transduction histidine kinase
VGEATLRGGAGGIRLRTTAASVSVVGIALVAAAFGAVAFVGRSLESQAGDEAALRAGQIAESGVVDGTTIAVPDAEEEFVQVLDGTDVVASTANVAGLAALAIPQPEEAIRVNAPFASGPFLAAADAMDTPHGPRTVVVGVNIDDVVEARNAVAIAMLVGVPLLLVIVGLVTWWIVGRTLRPVEDIRAEVERISARDLHRRLPTLPGRDEVGRLAGTLNRMLARLDDAHERQQRFVSDASHELRSPVASIRQHAEVARAHPETTDLRDLTDVVLEEDARLETLVDDLLLLARLDENGEPGETEEVDMDDLVLAEAARLRAMDGLVVDAHLVSPARVIGNRAQLERLLRNLGDNAARHARGEIALSVATADGSVVLKVDDDGAGISVPDRTRVFERFVRLDESRARSVGGAGLGLAIVREIARAHGGEVALAETPLGGVRAEIRLPMASAYRSATISVDTAPSASTRM